MRTGLVVALALAASAPLALSGCQSALSWVAMPFLYREAELPPEQVVRDVPYRTDRAPDGSPVASPKHQLDLFLPRDPDEPGPGPAWPVLVFVHGGGWTSGDRGLRAAGRDVYGNIGRFYAGRGVGTAVISYRLQPEVVWRDQVRDVARAVAWVHANIGAYGGDPRSIFLAGHSAGAQLSAHVALGPALADLGAADVRPCGLIPVSGAGLDLSDARTYELGASRRYYERRFRNGDAGDAWLREASPASYAHPGAPPALILYAEGEAPTFERQAEVLDAALRQAEVPSRVFRVPGEDHQRIVLALSHPEKTPPREILGFIRDNHCAERG